MMLSSGVFSAEPARALAIRQRRLQARMRLGQNPEETERECRALLTTAEEVGTRADVVNTRLLLVVALVSAGNVDAAITLAEESVRIAEAGGDEALTAEAVYRLAVTLLNSRPRDGAELLLRLVARARSSGNRALEARALLNLGVARTRTRDDRAGAEAFRAALTIAREVNALDTAASASMNLGVLELRRGDFAAAYDACKDALRLYTTLRNNTSRLVALYNMGNLERERGDAEAAALLYEETSELATQLGVDDVGIAARAGVGIAALRLDDLQAARDALQTATTLLGTRVDWWFQGRELLESLAVRIGARDGDVTGAMRRLRVALEQIETLDVYATAWLVTECAADLSSLGGEIWGVVEQFARHGLVQEFAPLAARFTALRDLADRPTQSRKVTPTASMSRI
jgi:tetratricopeptide (TPR) repeat protein